jgi:UTP--glucose-1-phosphate uridylyltransferase
VISRAVIPAAGLGTRFLPATKVLPKEILPVVDKPVIEFAVDEARAAGVTEVTIVTSPGKGLLMRHFEPTPELESYLEARGKTEMLEKVRAVAAGVRVAEVTQVEPLGLGHAVLQAESAVGDQYFGCLLPDDVFFGASPVLKQMAEIHQRLGCSVLAVRKVPLENIGRFGSIKIGGQVSDPAAGVYEVADLVEKPKPEEAPSDLAVMGRYILSPGVFEALRETERGAGGEIQLTDGIRNLLGTERVVALEYTADYFDVGTIPGWLKTSIALGRARPEFREDIEAYLRLLLESPADRPPPTG